jgi:hypothetical protein
MRPAAVTTAAAGPSGTTRAGAAASIPSAPSATADGAKAERRGALAGQEVTAGCGDSLDPAGAAGAAGHA